MPPVMIRRRFPIVKLATFAFVLTVFAFVASDASAQSGGRLQAYSERWYGQNFYDHQHNGYFSRCLKHRQSSMGIYGPAQMYGRQYADQNGLATDRPFVRKRPMEGVGSYSNPYSE